MHARPSGSGVIWDTAMSETPTHDSPPHSPSLPDSIDETKKFRNLSLIPKAIERTLVVALTLLGAAWAVELHLIVGLNIFAEQFFGLIFAIGIGAVFIRVKARRNEPGDGVPWYDWLLFAASVVVGLYVVINYRVILADLGSLSPDRYLLGLVAVVTVLEATRRTLGMPLVWLALIFIAYTLTSHLFPGMLNMPSPRWERVAAYLYLDGNALFGLPMNVTASIIIAFILFGRVLYSVNGDKLLTDFALSAMGRYRGGPAKVAVIASSFFGTISGSAVSNVVMDGPITIPMMKRSGYPAHLAAATEAVASTGGQIMPPVMGIAAFLIAEYLQISYGEVVVAALIPAVLYYIALFVQVDLEAAKHNMSGLPLADLPRMREVGRRGWVFVIPIGVLIWTLVFENWRPGKSAMAAVVLALVVGFTHPDTRPSLRRLWVAIEETGRTILDLIVISAIAGVVIGALQISGLSFNFSLLLIHASHGSVLVLLGLTAIVCIILGMGMPTGVIYVMLALLVAPALEEMGVLPMSAHLFLFYFGMLSMITPPMCIATFAAATIAETPFWKAGWAGVRLGIAAYVVPFAMVFQPGLIFEGSVFDIAVAGIKAAIGVTVMAVGVTGYLHGHLGSVMRLAFLITGLVILLTPFQSIVSGALVFAALVVAAGLYQWDRRTNVAQTVAGE